MIVIPSTTESARCTPLTLPAVNPTVPEIVPEIRIEGVPSWFNVAAVGRSLGENW
jgi:hypothetical protein